VVWREALATMVEDVAVIHEPTPRATEQLRAGLTYIRLTTVQLAYARPTRTGAFMIQNPFVEDSELMGSFLDHNKCRDRTPAGDSLLSVYMDTAPSTRWRQRSDDGLIAWDMRRRSPYSLIYAARSCSRHLLVGPAWAYPTNRFLPGRRPGASQCRDSRTVVATGDW